jgi:hypothetical protein
MYSVTHSSSQQIFAVVGSAYISEHHSDDSRRYLTTAESEGLFDEILNALRSALSCCRQH